MQERYLNGNPALNASRDYVTSTLGGNATNPFLDQMIQQTGDETYNRLGAGLNKLGLGPAGSTFQGTQARELGKVGLGMRYADWEGAQDRKANAAGLAPGISAAETASIAPMLGVAELGANLPMDNAMKFAGGVSGLLGDYTNAAKRDTPSTAAQIGKGLKVAGNLFSIFSDERLKENISEVGKTKGGLGVYTYNYKGDPTPQMGVMAQEVAKKQPAALGPTVGGYKSVQYGKVR